MLYIVSCCILLNIFTGESNTENMLEMLCEEENKVTRSSSGVVTINMTTTKNTTVASGIIVAVTLGRALFPDKEFSSPESDVCGKALFSVTFVHLPTVGVLSLGLFKLVQT